MALSLLNYFLWEIPEARVPFLIADGVVIVALHYMDKGMKAEKALREMEAANEVKVEHESDKAESRAVKGALRQQQKQAQRVLKHQANAGGSSKKQNNIQQPKKD